MLVELRIRDFAVVEDLTLTLGPGLNALTGETGAGKSIIVGALSLLLGERASSDVVRRGADRASVEAVFDVGDGVQIQESLESYGLRMDDGLLILRREVAAEGRNRAWVNGSPTTATIVGELGTSLVDLHGQHEHQTLLKARDQRDILDAFGGSTALARRVRGLHGRLEEIGREIEEREERRREVESRADFLRFQLGEIDGAAPVPGEDDELQLEAGRLEHGEELAHGASGVHQALYGDDDSIADRLSTLQGQLQRLADFDPSLAEMVRSLDELWHASADIGRRLGDYASAVEHDPARLEEVRSRLDQLFRLKRKYGPELADVLATAQRVRTELGDLDDADHDLAALAKEAGQIRTDLTVEAEELTRVRVDAAARLGRDVSTVLPSLGMPGGAFDVRLSTRAEVGPGGAETVEFLVAPNVGFEPAPLSKIASGGELSRVMLALKSVLADVDDVPVLVFDEIDAGIGGAIASAVADKLARVSERHQVFVVTHLAQVASRAAGHLLVQKEVQAGVTSAGATLLDGESRVEEIARMLGGDPDSDVSRSHARELLGT